MRKSKKNIVFLSIFFLFLVMSASRSYAAETVTINQLIENTAKYDNLVVTVEGEIIGEALERGDFAWINLNDTTNAIGIWMKLSDAQQLQYYGDYSHRGDIIKITGKFSRACAEHGGDFDIHSNRIEVVKEGWIVKEIVSSYKIMVTVVLLIIASILLALYIKLVGKKELEN